MANIINGTDTGSGGLITTGDSSDELQLQTAETARVTLTNTAVVVNEGGNDVDFRVESDTNANALFVDGSSQEVFIGGTTSLTSDRPAISVISNFGAPHINMLRDDSTTVGSNPLGEIRWYSNDSTSNTPVLCAKIEAQADLDHGAGDNPTNMVFYTTPDNSTTLTEAARFTNAGNLKFPDGQGIDFSASAGGGATSSILDDYEEGTWTPEVRTGSEDTFTTSVGSATYTKIGRQVIAQCHGTFTSTASTSQGQLYLTALPFSVAGGNVGDAGGNGFVTSISGQEMGSVMYFNTNGTLIATKTQVDSGGSGVSRTYRIYFSYVAA